MKKLLMMSFCLLAVYSCKKATYIDTEVRQIEANAEAQDGCVTIKTDGKSCEVEHAPSWAHTSVTDLKVNYSLQENDWEGVRYDSIVVTSGDQRLSIPVAQYCHCTYMTAEQTSVRFGKEGGKTGIAIDTDGLPKVKVAGGKVKATYADGVLTIAAKPNTQSSPVKETITLSADDIEVTINVTLGGDKCETCNGKGKVTCPSCGGKGYSTSGAYGMDACKRCGGVSYHGSSFYPHDGTGRITCPDCNGAGK